MSAEMPTRGDVRQAIREKLSGQPLGADAQGRTDLDRQLAAEAIARHQAADVAAAASLVGSVEPTAHGMRPNPAQGASGSTGVTPASPPSRGGSPFDRIRNIAARQPLDGGISA